MEDTYKEVAVKLDIFTLSEVKTLLIPCIEDVSCALEIYPSVARPLFVDNKSLVPTEPAAIPVAIIV